MDADILVHWTSASSEAIVYEKLNSQGSGTDLVVMFQNIELFGLLRDVAYDMWESDMWESGDMNHDDEAFEGRLFYSRRPWEIWLNSSSWSEGKQQNGVRYITHSWQRSKFTTLCHSSLTAAGALPRQKNWHYVTLPVAWVYTPLISEPGNLQRSSCYSPLAIQAVRSADEHASYINDKT